MPEHEARIRVGLSGTGSLVVGEHDLSADTVGFGLRCRVGHVPELTVDLVLRQTEADGPARVRIGAQTHAALVEMGWTPPPTEA